ncbi:MAG: glycosyltransferase family 9 protein [Bacteroidetes bacterium]|nr:glycosyltransferase family 9 protein [Bacteroidota bacterium]
MKLLILRFSSIGDIVLTTPVIRCLKNKFPEAEIHYATKEAFKNILQHNPYLTKIHSLQDSMVRLAETLKKESFDYIIDLHHNQRTLQLKFILNTPSSSFDKINLEKWLMVNFKINQLPKQHIVDRYLKACKEFEIINDGEGLDYFISQDDHVNVESIFPDLRNGYIAWVIGAKQNTKKFPPDKIARILSQIEYPVVLLGGKEDFGQGESIISAIQNSRSKVFNACGKYSLNQSASLVQQAKLVLTNDTGLMHIAAAFKKPIISFWGNTIPEFGMSPYYGRHQVTNKRFEIKDLNCRPCSKLGYDACPKGHFDCMNKLDEPEIVSSIQHFLRTDTFTV